MAYLVDGNNFIGHISPYELRNPQSKYSLISKLWIFHKINRTKIFVVFDGPPDPALSGKNFPDKSLTVIYPERGENADSAIKDLIAKHARTRRFFVVSSDREIKNYAQKNGVKPLSCEKFNKELKGVLKKNKALKEMEKQTDLPSPLEINHWADIFEKNK